MKYYFVSNMTPPYLKILKEEKCNILCSYYALETNWEQKLENYPYDIFLDCGAFSAWTLDDTIDFDAYLKFTKKHIHRFEKIASLDIQPKGNTKEDFQQSGEESFRNYQVMKKFISLSKLMPTFHWGEDFDLLKQYITDKVNIIALGGLAGQFREEGKLRIELSLSWFRKVFELYPKQKFHGFGLFSPSVVLNFPFYSMDSSHWLHSGRYAKLTKFNPKKMALEYFPSKSQKHWLKIEALGGTMEGFSQLMDIERKSDYLNRGRLAVREIKKYVDFITRLWEARGIKWEE